MTCRQKICLSPFPASFLAGPVPSIADCTLAAAFQFARFGGVEIDARYTHLARWDAAYRARPAAQGVLVA